jgi:DNA-binding MarR family transcriptional regulator/N-acetylglutamate synthase-like GNAT family acetyltransferase
MPMDNSELFRHVDAVRRFGRFYTRRIGLLQGGLLGSSFSLTEGRVLYELAQRQTPSAADLAGDLQLDPGYLSRILRGFERRGLMRRRPAPADARRTILDLTPKGQAAFATINARSRDQVAAMLERLAPANQVRLVKAMKMVEEMLDAEPERRAPYILRPHQVGDMGWVVNRHGVLYAREFGWDERFEALVAGIVSEFIKRYDAAREACWIAEREGQNIGCVFLVKHSARVGKLRLLLVEPGARGQGIGSRLVAECVERARQVGYRRLTLWTNDVLHSARKIYQAAGFCLRKEERHNLFGKGLVGQYWELEL